jgi:imidazolonepropionase-like amidohydrolase
MKYLFRITLLSFGILFISNCFAQIGFPKNGPNDKRVQLIAFVHANIQTTPNTLLKDATLIIKEGKIDAIQSSSLPIPKEAKIINLNGRYIYPSFIDLFSSYGLNQEKESKHKKQQQYENNKPGAYTWNDAIHLDRKSVEIFEFDDKKSEQYLSSGFGSTLSILQDGIFRGSGTLVLTGKGPEHQLIINTETATGLSFNKGNSKQDYPGSAMGVVALIRQTYYDADYYGKNKEEVNLSFEQFQKHKNLPAIFETENKYAALRAAKIGKEFGINYLLKSTGDDYQRIQEIKATGNSLIIPINFPKPFEVQDPFDAERINLADLKHWEMAPKNPAIVNTQGIPFAITSSGCANAEEFLNNLRKAVSYGLSKEAALNALTLSPAKMLNVATKIGSLQKGMMANFFISSNDLFEPNSEILDHYTNGNHNALKPWNNQTLAGVYELNLPELGLVKLVIKNDKTLETFVWAKDSLKINLSQKSGYYSSSIPASKESELLIRLEFWVSKTNASQQATEIKGLVWDKTGNTHSFSGKLIENTIAKQENKNIDSSQQFGQIIYPFSEFGLNQTPMQESVIFKNATIWTNEKDGILKETDVAISKGKIIAIGKNLTLANAKIVDCKGKHLSSGIIDEHSHIGIYRGVNECTQNNTAEVRIGDVINADDINIYRQLSGGVIACQQLHGSCNPIGGQSSIIKLRWGKAPEEMKFKEADGFIKFALGENVKQSNWGNETSRYPQTRMGVEQVYFDAFIRAKEYEKKLKENPSLTRKDLELETLVEILNKKRFISCHSYVQSEINMLMKVGDSLGFKVNTFTHILEGYKVADKMKAHGANASTFADWWAYKYEVIDAIPQNAAILNQMGIVTAVNSDDAEMGRRLNQEAAKMIKYGNLSEEAAWKMVTLNPAKMLRIEKYTGSIQVGKDADLVVWSDNPLSIYAKTEMTFVDGICYFSLEKDKELRISIKKERERIIQKMILAKQKGEKTTKHVSVPDMDYHCDTVEEY